jgi:uncharacterized protein DUF6165
MPAIPHIPVSWGELIDKLTILEIKTERLPQAEARANAAHERTLLAAVAAPVLAGECAVLAAELKALNLALWEIEDRIRAHERDRDFGAGFVELARAVYRTNDARGALKRRINQLLGSELVEEKGYQPY